MHARHCSWDFADVINPTRRDTHCWLLSHRLRAKDIEELGGGRREKAMHRLCEREDPPGVITYRDDVPVGWCSAGPRLGSRASRDPSSSAPWTRFPCGASSAWRFAAGTATQDITIHLLKGTVAYAASQGASAIEAYPVDPEGRMDTTTAFVGTRGMFEQARFRVIGTTDAVASRMPRLVMRRDL